MLRRSLDKLFIRFRDEHDGSALAAVFDRTSQSLLDLACHLVRTPSDAEDLVQSTFLAAIVRAQTYDGSASIEAWLYGILWREAAKARRAASRVVDPHRLEPKAEREPSDQLARREVPPAISRAIDRLPQRYREVLDPFFGEDKSPEAIARQLGRSSGTVRSQIQRGIERLRRALPEGTAAIVPVSVRGLPAIRESILKAAGCSSATAPAAGTLILGVPLGTLAMSKAAVLLSGLLFGALAGSWVTRITLRSSSANASLRPALADRIDPASGTEPTTAKPISNSGGLAEDRRPVAPERSPTQEDPIAYWLARFNEAPDDWRHGYKIANEIAKLPPDDALHIMIGVWPNLTTAVKEQVLRPFLTSPVNVHVLKLLNLAATDAAASVQNVAFQNLVPIAFRDFALDYEGYLQWATRYAELPLREAMSQSAQDFIRSLRSLSPEELQQRVPALERFRFENWDPHWFGFDVAAVLKDAGGLKVLESLIQSGDSNSYKLGLQWSKWMHADESWLRTWILPAIEPSGSANPEILPGALLALGRPDCTWAREPILSYLASRAELETPVARAASMALAEIGDPAAIPGLIELLLHDQSGKLNYDIGYWALAKLAGVRWQENYDGGWWLDWWDKNKMRFPPEVRDTTIRR